MSSLGLSCEIYSCLSIGVEVFVLDLGFVTVLVLVTVLESLLRLEILKRFAEAVLLILLTCHILYSPYRVVCRKRTCLLSSILCAAVIIVILIVTQTMKRS